MGCNCGSKNRTQYEVVTADGRIAYTTPSKPAAEGVARRYAGATVREKGKPQTASEPAQATGDPR